MNQWFRKNKPSFLNLTDILHAFLLANVVLSIDQLLQLPASASLKLSVLQKVLDTHRGSRVKPILSIYKTCLGISAEAGRSNGLTNSQVEVSHSSRGAPEKMPAENG